jgi:4-hydroxy-tetrahydrodipicolinate synthase
METSLLPVVGVCPVIETPFADDGEVDFVSFGRVVEYVAHAGARSVMFPGFASEFYKISDDERRTLTLQLVRIARGFPDFSVIVSVPDHATRVAVAVAVAAVEAGASAVNVLPPYQLGPSGDSVRAHLLAILEAVAPTPVIVQYAPAQTGTTLDAASLSRIASEAPNLRQVKVESTPPGTFITSLLAQEPPLASIVGYGGVQLIDALRRGVSGVQPGCSFIELYLEIWNAWQRGDVEAAIGLHGRLLPYISYWMQGVELIVAAEKRISQRRGIIFSDHCRVPARLLDYEENAMIERFLEEFEPELSNWQTGRAES